MKATIEISLYPLDASYEAKVLAFLESLKGQEGIEVMTNGLSTQIFGNYEDLMTLLTKEMKAILEDYPAIFVLKLGKGILKFP